MIFLRLLSITRDSMVSVRRVDRSLLVPGIGYDIEALLTRNEPRREKTGVFPMRNQRRRSASR